jgi:hypothetical protein
MNIKELKEKLNEFPDDMEVVISYYEGEGINCYYHHFIDVNVLTLNYYDYSIRDNHYEYYDDSIFSNSHDTPKGVVVVHPEERNVVLIEVDR